MFNVKSKLQWFGGKVMHQVDTMIDKGAINCGEKVTALAKQYAPKDTHNLEQSISYTYNASAKTLRILVGAPYGPYQEFGTYKMPPHPFIRPALAIAGPSFLAPFGVDVSMATSLPIGYVPRVIRPTVRPKIAAAQKKYSKGVVKRTPMEFKHVGSPGKPVNAWAAHRDMSKLFKSKTDWNRESISARVKKRNFGV